MITRTIQWVLYASAVVTIAYFTHVLYLSPSFLHELALPTGALAFVGFSLVFWALPLWIRELKDEERFSSQACEALEEACEPGSTLSQEQRQTLMELHRRYRRR